MILKFNFVQIRYGGVAAHFIVKSVSVSPFKANFHTQVQIP